jgi:hypothetical protein
MQPVIPGLTRNPGFFWIPAFAGMTIEGNIGLFTKPPNLKNNQIFLLCVPRELCERNIFCNIPD